MGRPGAAAPAGGSSEAGGVRVKRLTSVSNLKQALETEQSKAAEVAAASINAIDAMLSLSQFVLGAVALVIALVAIAGVSALVVLARRQARKTADGRLDAYLSSPEFEARMEVAVKAEVRRRLENKMILAHIEPERDGGEADPFPSAPLRRPTESSDDTG